MLEHNRRVAKENDKHASVSITYEIDQRAIKTFLGWLPDNWLPRKQDPDFFVDYEVETVECGEPTGMHFCAQIKGFKGAQEGPLSYSFKTKHLKYYLQRSPHPVFLFLINTNTDDGYWLFAQKYLNDSELLKKLEEQSHITVHFSAEDNLHNAAKFKCLLHEAHRYVLDLHPGSVKAALQRRKSELEQRDPRCVVSININEGAEHISITPKENFSFQTRIRSKNTQGWRDFFERGAEIKVEAGEIEFVGAPLLEEMNEKGGFYKIQLGAPQSGAIQFVCGTGEEVTVIEIAVEIRTGTKFVTFKGELPGSPLSANGEIPLKDEFQKDAQSSLVNFSLNNWIGQRLLHLAYFDQIESLVSTLARSDGPKLNILIRGNTIWSGRLGHFENDSLQSISLSIDWIKKCRWLAGHFGINPTLPSIQDISDEKWDSILETYDLLQNKSVSNPVPDLKINCSTNSPPPNRDLFCGDGVLRIESPNAMLEFFGQTVRLGRVRYQFTGVKNAKCSPAADGGTDYVFYGNSDSMRTVTLLQ